MSEYIVQVLDEQAEQFIAKFGIEGTKMFGFQLTGEIVRCRDCKHRYACGSFMFCEFRRPDEPVNADGYCSDGERRGDAE